MQLFARAVVTGFGLALGSALYKKLARKVGFHEPDEAPARAPAVEHGEVAPQT